jgi:hypothetical protein
MHLLRSNTHSFHQETSTMATQILISSLLPEMKSCPPSRPVSTGESPRCLDSSLTRRQYLTTSTSSTSTSTSTSNKKRRALTMSPSSATHHKKARTVSPSIWKKTVRFDLEQNTTLQLPCTSHNTPTSSHDLWLSVQELHEIRHREATVLHRHCLRNDIYLDQIAVLLSMACNAPTSGGILQAPRATVAAAVSIVCNSPARGLEKEVMACVRQRRKLVIQTFLKSQMAVKAAAPPTDQEATLAHHYIQLARPACRLARWIAQGDALVIAKDLA